VGGEIIERLGSYFFLQLHLNIVDTLWVDITPATNLPHFAMDSRLFGADLFFSPAEFQSDWVPLSHHSSKTHRPPCSVSYVENEVICLDRVWNLCFLGENILSICDLPFQGPDPVSCHWPTQGDLIENEHLLYGFIQRDQPLSMESQLIHSLVTKKGWLNNAIYMPNQFVFPVAPMYIPYR